MSEATAAKAREVATALIAQGGVTAVPATTTALAVQIAGLAEDLLVTARDNRGILLEVVRAEAERAIVGLGVVTTAEADSLRRRIADLERTLANERRANPDAGSSAQLREAGREAPTPGRERPAPKKQVVTDSAASGETAADGSAVESPPPSKRPAATRKTATKRPAGNKAATKKPTTKKPTTKKTAVKKPATKKTAAKKTVAEAAARTSTRRSATSPATAPGATDD